jgi:hypothetical protein
MSKSKRSEQIVDTGMGLVNGIILHHIATCIPQAIALNGKEMQLAMDKSDKQNDSWEDLCASIESRTGLAVMDGNWELERLVLGGEVRPLH